MYYMTVIKQLVRGNLSNIIYLDYEVHVVKEKVSIELIFLFELIKL